MTHPSGKNAKNSQDRPAGAASWLLIILLSVVTFTLVTESFDSTILKLPLLVAGSGILAIVLLLRRTKGRAPALSAVHAAFMLLILAGAASLAHAIQVSDGLIGLLTLGCCFLLFAASAETFQESADERLLQNGLLAIAGATSLIGLVQAFAAEPIPLLFSMGDHAVFSTLGNTSYYAGFLVLLLPIVIGIGLSRKAQASTAALCAGLAVVMLFLLVRTESRSSWLALLVALPLLLLLVSRTARTGWLLAAGALAVLALLAVLFPDLVMRRIEALFDSSGTSSFARRLAFYDASWRAFLSSPFIGNGIGNFVLFLPKFRTPEYWLSKSEDIVPHAHNEFLEILAETGIFGFFAFCAVLGLFFWYARKALKGTAGADRALLAGYVCALVAVLIDNLGSINLRTIPVAAGFWIIAGTSMKYLRVLPQRLPAVPLGRSVRYILALAIAAAMPFLVIATVGRFRAERSFMQALVARSQGNTAAVATQLERTLEAYPHHREAMLYLATNLIERSEYRRGLTLIDQFLAEYPFTPKAHLLRGLALFGLNDIAGAREEARKEFAIAGYPQAYYYAARFAKAAGDSADERRCLLLQLERCAASRRDTYVLDAVRALPAVCTPESRDSCVAILRQVGAAFGTQAETARALMRSYLQMGVRAEAESLAQQATAAGTLRKEDCDEVLREIRGTGQ